VGVIVQFDPAAWKARYPEFSAVSDATAQGYFAEACVYHANDGGGPVKSSATQAVLLNMATAHIAARYAANASPLVGRITTAGEGSVSVSTALEVPAGSAQWWAQTKYGLDYWQATASYRTMQYRTPFGRARAVFPLRF
jgi:Protein of unknown function (DUF4054)